MPDDVSKHDQFDTQPACFAPTVPQSINFWSAGTWCAASKRCPLCKGYGCLHSLFNCSPAELPREQCFVQGIVQACIVGSVDVHLPDSWTLELLAECSGAQGDSGMSWNKKLAARCLVTTAIFVVHPQLWQLFVKFSSNCDTLTSPIAPVCSFVWLVYSRWVQD